MVGKITKDNWLSFIATFLVCMLCVGTAYRHTSMIVTVLFALILILAWFVKPRNLNYLQKKEKLYVFALIFFFCSALLSYIAGSGWELKSIRNPSMPSLIDLDLPSKYLLGALIFFLFVKLNFKICKKAVFYAIGLGGIVNGCIAIYERYALGIGRIDGWSGIAEMADASAILGIFSLILFIFSPSSKERIFYFFASFMACFASILTGTRGAMLGIIITFIFIVVLIAFFERRFLKQIMFIILIGILSFGVSLNFDGKTKETQQRLELVDSDLKNYAKGNVHTSIGMRFEMWKEAIAMFKMAPIFGLSSAEISKKMPEILQKSGSQLQKTQPQNDARGNKHNQILNQAAKRGIVGVVAILLIWFASFALFSSFSKDNQEMLMLSMLSTSMTFYFIFPNSFTGEPWESNVSFPLMTLFICIFWKMLKADQQNAH